MPAVILRERTPDEQQKNNRRTPECHQRTTEDPRAKKHNQMLMLFLSSSASTGPALRRPAWRSTSRTVVFAWFWEMGHQPIMQTISKSVCFPSMCEPCENVILWMDKKQNRRKNYCNLIRLRTSYDFVCPFPVKSEENKIAGLRFCLLFEWKGHKKP